MGLLSLSGNLKTEFWARFLSGAEGGKVDFFLPGPPLEKRLLIIHLERLRLQDHLTGLQWPSEKLPELLFWTMPKNRS